MRDAMQTAAKMTAKLAESEGARDASERMIALGRLGGAPDVARAVEFLLHPDSSYITGVPSRSAGMCTCFPEVLPDSQERPLQQTGLCGPLFMVPHMTRNITATRLHWHWQ